MRPLLALVFLSAVGCAHLGQERIREETRLSVGRWQAACGDGVFEYVTRLEVKSAALAHGILGAAGVGMGVAPPGVSWVLINRDADWSAYDLGTVLDHELGHVLGLVHTNQKAGRPLMRPQRDVGDRVVPEAADCPPAGP